MIIDIIIERKENNFYDIRQLYLSALYYDSSYCAVPNKHKISYSLDYGTEADIKKTLCQYIDDNEYNANLKNYINSVDWLV